MTAPPPYSAVPEPSAEVTLGPGRSAMTPFLVDPAPTTPHKAEQPSQAAVESPAPSPAPQSAAKLHHPPPRSTTLTRPQPSQQSSPGFLRPQPVRSPWDKAPKTKVTNFREGVAEGGRAAAAHLIEGAKAPVWLAWKGASEGGLVGRAVGGTFGLAAGAIHLGLSPINASIAFLNHSSRGIIRGSRSNNAASSTSSAPQASNDQPHPHNSAFAPEFKADGGRPTSDVRAGLNRAPTPPTSSQRGQRDEGRVEEAARDRQQGLTEVERLKMGDF